MVGQTTWWMYVIETDQGPLYTGVSTDVERRFDEHCQVHEKVPGAKGAKYFRRYRPKMVVLKVAYDSQAEACSEEYAFKQLTRKQKLAHIVAHNQAETNEFLP